MDRLLRLVYLNSPFLFKKVFANAEALRRNIYRRSGNYKNHYKNLNLSKMLIDETYVEQVNKINTLLTYIRKHVPFYQESLYKDRILSINDIKNLPLTSKSLMRNDINSFINKNSNKKLWKGRTSGSTGTSFSYYRDKNSMQFEYALYDKLYEYLSGSKDCTKVRISGVNIVKPDCKEPPFWYFIKVYNQLQCSAYHIDSKTYIDYLDALSRYRISLGTGYASSWLFLSQYILDNNMEAPKLSVIVTDSEGVSSKDKIKIEKAFNCSVYQTYGLSEVGMLAVQCKNGHYHTFADRCYLEIIDESGKKVNDGEIGEIVVTDLHSFNAPFIRYKTGDRGVIGQGDCGCGWKTPYLKELVGRLDDYVLTSDGRKISRLGHIAKPAKGVLGMQLIQNRVGHLEIKVLPADEFEHESMNEVIKEARNYLGDMKITWSLVGELEKTKSGKIKYIIRRI